MSCAALTSDQLMILEGIHGLNPQLLPDIPAEQTFRIYVSCLTQLNLDRHNRISTTDTRLIRRIVRDAKRARLYCPADHQRWESVRVARSAISSRIKKMRMRFSTRPWSTS